MDSISKLLIHFLGVSLFQDEQTIKQSVQKQSMSEDVLVALFDEARKQTVFPIVYYTLREEAKRVLNEENREKYNRLFLSQYSASVRSMKEHLDLSMLLSSHGVKHVIIKGQTSASYYPNPKLRPSGDVDFLIEKNDRTYSNDILQEAGYVFVKESKKHDFHWTYEKSNSSIELHWDIPGLPEDSIVLRQLVSSVFEESNNLVLLDGCIKAPSLFHHGLILLLHMLSHLTSTGVGLRHLCDWLVFVEKIQDDEFLYIYEDALKQSGLWVFAQVVTQIGVKFFYCRTHSWCSNIDEELCDRILDEFLLSGNFGLNDDGSRKLQTKMIRNTRTRQINGKSILSTMISNVNSRAKKKYPRMKSYPFLLPIGWAGVGIEYMKWSRSKGNKSLNRKIYLEARNRQHLYEQLKLFDTNQNDK